MKTDTTTHDFRLVRCVILTGTYPRERIFEITLAAGGKKTGSADICWFRDENRQQLPMSQPLSILDRVSGFVVCRVMNSVNNKANIELPDMSTTSVPKADLEDSD